MASYQRLKTSDDYPNPEPELKLWRAVLSTAAEDATKNKRMFTGIYNEIDSARSWFTSPTKNFFMVCYYAGFEPRYILYKMRKAIKNVEKLENEKNMQRMQGKRFFESSLRTS